ncbi:hypothetical protein [Nodosilinea nodulosa]|uniref:hypothetical protein n=1 Tax=Nodosilinea nodulosa TaxID=416001 RepID=UPI0012D7B08B|nr:hypothetical protein [Nodosilinea nodulosa]
MADTELFARLFQPWLQQLSIDSFVYLTRQNRSNAEINFIAGVADLGENSPAAGTP